VWEEEAEHTGCVMGVLVILMRSTAGTSMHTLPPPSSLKPSIFTSPFYSFIIT